MKIVCDKCAAKYSIADEKVSGKVFKLRCKKCGHIIVVKGTTEGEATQAVAQSAGSPAEAAAAAGDPAGGDAVWHLVIDREQVGPMSPQEVRAKVQGGQVDGDTYIWKEGFADWVKLASVDEFRDLFGGPGASDNQATRRQDPRDLFRQASLSEPGPGADLFGNGAAASQAIQTSAPTAQTIMAPGGAAHFASSYEGASQGTPQPSAATPGFGGGGMAASPGGFEVKSMTGARSENSVLFSLNNLQALAMGGPASSPAASASRPGYASTASEASGLIDIRAMAAQTLSANAFSAGLAGSKPDDLPMMSDAPMFSAVAPAVLLPTAEPVGMPKWVWILLGVGGLGILAVAVVLIVLLTSTPPPPSPALPAAGPLAQVGPPGQDPGQAAPKQPVVQPAEPKAGKPAQAAAKEKEPGDAAAGDAKKDRRPRDKERDRGDKPARKEKEPVQEAAPPPVEAEKKPKPAKPKDDLDSLLESATGGSSSKPKVGATAKDAPEQLSMDTIKAGLKAVSGAVQACGTPGTYMVKLTIGRNGRVSDATVTNKPGDPAADCVSRAVKTARFPEFTGAPQGMTYPFIVR